MPCAGGRVCAGSKSILTQSHPPGSSDSAPAGRWIRCCGVNGRQPTHFCERVPLQTYWRSVAHLFLLTLDWFAHSLSSTLPLPQPCSDTTHSPDDCNLRTLAVPPQTSQGLCRNASDTCFPVPLQCMQVLYGFSDPCWDTVIIPACPFMTLPYLDRRKLGG